MSPEHRASAPLIAAAFGDPGRAHGSSPVVASTPELRTPVHVRPDSVFALDTKSDGSASTPAFEAENIRGLDDLGPHRYDSGVLSLAGDDPRAASGEHNGLVYTCRAGFIDTSRVRDSADMTLFLSSEIELRLDRGGAIALADQGGTRYVLVRRIDSAGGPLQRRVLAANLAAWAAFQISVWRDIARWYGYGTQPGLPERVVAFTPPGLYSDLLGVEIGRAVAIGDSAAGLVGDRAVDAWIAGSLEYAGIVPQASAVAALRSLDGTWWDSSRSPPDWKLVRRRRFDIGDESTPWLVSAADADEGSFRDCHERGEVLELRNPAHLDGIVFGEVVNFEIEVDERLADHGFPFPRSDSDIVTPADFPAIIEQIRRENRDAMGENADRPGGS